MHPVSFLFASAGNTDRILAEMLLVFAAAKIMAELSEKLRQPAVAGELLAGILIGPAVLGWVQPSDFLTALAELGVLFLLFRVGLELRDFELNKVGADSALVAVAGIVFPFFAGYWIMRTAGYAGIESIFVGAAMVATSVGITARVLAAKGLLDERASKIILAAAIIDDVLGLIVLAVVSAMSSGRVNFAELAVTAGLAIGFTFLVAQWGKQTVAAVLPRFERRLSASEGKFVLAILLLLLLSLLALYAGVAAIIGAFLAGMALANITDHHVHDMVGGVTELLVPFFLVGIGLQFDFAPFRNPELVQISIFLIFAAVATKLLGCGLGAMRLGAANAMRIGAGMVPRGEVGMVVASIGLSLGAISDGVFGMVVMISIATTLIAPPLLNFTFRGLEDTKEAIALPRVK
jgi:Kef-type K+ transport system membrane component KefB